MLKITLRGLIWIVLFSAVGALPILAGTVNYSVDHKSQKSSDLPPVTIEHGDTLDIEVRNTNTDCYFYNARVKVAEEGQVGGFREEPPPKDVEHLTVTHDESVIAYQVEITPRGTDACKEVDKLLGARSYTIPVRALWNLVGASGLVGHDLVNPEFYLQQQDGKFIVRRQAENEDDLAITGAAVLHLYRSARGWKGVSWAPLTFGLSIDSKRSDYLLGTTARFGNRVYLTFGRLFGNVNRLPNGLAIDMPTDNANALSNIPTQRKGTWFVSASFGFLTAGVSNLFKTKVGVPQVPGTTATQGVTDTGTGTGAAAPVAITAAPESGPAGTSVELNAPETVAFGPAGPNSRLEVTDSKSKITDFASRGAGTVWADKSIKFTFPSPAAPGEASIAVLADGKKVATSKFNVIPVITANPEHGTNATSVKLAQAPDMDFGNGADSVIVLEQGDTTRTLASNATGVTWKPELITFTPGTQFAAGDVAITVKVGGKTVARSKYKVD